MLTFIDFFAGVGGFRRGMELAGHKCIGFCEFDKYAIAMPVLKIPCVRCGADVPVGWNEEKKCYETIKEGLQ